MVKGNTREGSNQSRRSGDTIDRLDTVVEDIYSLHELAPAVYSDQVLPFDITLAGANEYGAMCAAKILGVEILNEGTGVSIDDAVSEASATFVARAVEPMQAVPSPEAMAHFDTRLKWMYTGGLPPMAPDAPLRNRSRAAPRPARRGPSPRGERAPPPLGPELPGGGT